MSEITLLEKDQVYCRINSDDVSILQELSDYFTFEQPGARFMPQFRAKLWDGKIRLFNLFRQELYVGLIPYVKLFAEQNQYKVNDQRTALPEPYIDVQEFLQSLDLQGHGKPIDIRDYQIDAVRHAIYNHRALLLSPPPNVTKASY
jgi:hypothetical protein